MVALHDGIGRRGFIGRCAGAALGAAGALKLRAAPAPAAGGGTAEMRFGLVTYLWAQDWDLPALISNCERSGVLGVELRTTHRHGVEPSLNAAQRAEVKKRFADSPVTLAGIGSNERLDSPDPAVLARSIEAIKEFVVLSRDVGGSGVKVKPDSFHKDVPRETTIAQIGAALNRLGAFAADYGQQIRLEVHGACSELPAIKAIMDIAAHRNVAVCWNSNAEDLKGAGLEHNFALVKDRLGATAHVRELDSKSYPWAQLIALFVKAGWKGWLLLEAGGAPKDPVAALIAQRKVFEALVAEARKKAQP
ncbi:MAG TPA: xylose isomerase [Planctomycetes bacterium]|jgi:hypothetical protein|nr:xylose isomerase [Planctomycetota bacterium]